MSHIVTISTQVKDPAAIRDACENLHLEPPIHGEAELFGGSCVGWQVRLPDWRYPLVCNTDSGTLHYDVYEGRWGDEVHLSRFLQRYSAEKARIEAHKRGHSVTEQSLEDGSIKLTVTVGGAN